ncbi:MAG: V-type ATP synthase subunit D [Bacteroidetes bacterium]|nr:V-type ATP synthase subunit D [Bacteroidota bacterium]
MAIKFQYNKTSLNDMEKQRKIRTRALPTIKSKESALRLEVKKAKDKREQYNSRMEELNKTYDYMVALWGEFDSELISVKDIELGYSKIAGVMLPVIKDISFEQKDYNLFSSPIWISDGVKMLKEYAEMGLRRELAEYRVGLLDVARKKTTQKVNLYEKVQIPGYNEAIMKIKRFMEDEENLSKASQKIVKSRQEREKEEA